MIRAFFAAILFSIVSVLSAATIEEGKQYQLVEPPILVTTAENEIEVIDFFSYGCPHCASLAPYITAWEATKPVNVVVKKVPIEFQATWEVYAKLYYTAAALNVADKVEQPLFAAVQKGEDLTDLEVAGKIFAEQGVDIEKFKSTFNSFSVNTALNQGRFITKQYKVSRIPLLIVDGRYQTSLSSAAGPQGVIDTLNFLIAKVEEQRKAKKESSATSAVTTPAP